VVAPGRERGARLNCEAAVSTGVQTGEPSAGSVASVTKYLAAPDVGVQLRLKGEEG
jgi:hypothetical protein